MQIEVPGWAKYVVVAPLLGVMAPCTCLEAALRCIRENGLAFQCEVTRVADDVCVWPMVTKGGSA